MSAEQFDEFFNRMMGDRELRRRMASVSYDDPELPSAIAKIAQDAGFDVSEDDVRDAKLTSREAPWAAEF